LAYKESIEALMCSIRFGEESIVHYEDVQSVKIVDSTVYPKEIEEDLLQAIHYGDTEVADKLLNEFIDNITSKQLSFAEYQVCFTRLLINIIIILQDSGESLHNIFNPHMRLFDELYSLTKPGEMKKWFIRSVIHPCLECLEQRRGNQYKHILDQVIQMVQQEYDTDLSLEICAERLNYHSSYIRRVLKKEMDITFSDYLANYRLAVAKRLLRESDLSVAEIAEKLRYHNPQNFIRYFKKLEGITPGQYREKFHLHS
ncbi:MAG TPA: helix-turn-helix transcriptional regulator, partial [Bacillota bacterium]|nr:helix-turn-helix transcriptional regulator [Bacillota bacterium]